MKNDMTKWGFVFAALTMAFSLTCTAYVYADSDEQAENPEISDEMQLLQMRADLMAEDVNDTINEEIKQVGKVKRNRYFEDFHTEPEEVNLFTNEELAAFEQQRQEKLEAIHSQLEYEVKDLEKIAKAATETQKQNPQAGVMHKPPFKRGTVAGIVIYQKKGAALVDGRIVRDNSTVRGIKVVSITKDYVEFEKDGKTWKQMVGQSAPDEFWAEPVVTAPAPKAESNQPATPNHPATPNQSVAPPQAPPKQPPAKAAPATKPANGKKTKVKK